MPKRGQKGVRDHGKLSEEVRYSRASWNSLGVLSLRWTSKHDVQLSWLYQKILLLIFPNLFNYLILSNQFTFYFASQLVLQSVPAFYAFWCNCLDLTLDFERLNFRSPFKLDPEFRLELPLSLRRVSQYGVLQPSSSSNFTLASKTFFLFLHLELCGQCWLKCYGPSNSSYSIYNCWFSFCLRSIGSYKSFQEFFAWSFRRFGKSKGIPR